MGFYYLIFIFQVHTVCVYNIVLLKYYLLSLNLGKSGYLSQPAAPLMSVSPTSLYLCVLLHFKFLLFLILG